MREITNEEIRPIVNIIDDKSFLIEDTRIYEPYKSNGSVIGINFSNIFKYKTFKKLFENP
jgi:hypothetical protein